MNEKKEAMTRRSPARDYAKGTRFSEDRGDKILRAGILSHVRGVVLRNQEGDGFQTLTLRTRSGNRDMMLVDNSAVFVETLVPMTLCDVILRTTGGKPFIAALLLPEVYELFSYIEPLSEKLDAIGKWAEMSEQERESIINTAAIKRFPRAASDEDAASKLERQLFRYNLTQEAYPVETQKTIQSLIQLCDVPMSRVRGNAERERSRLEYLVAITPMAKEYSPLLPQEAEAFLDKNFIGQKEAKQTILSFLPKRSQTSPGVRLLFLGPKGSGRTLLAQLTARILGKPVETVPLAGITTALDLLGNDPSFHFAEPGALFKAIHRAGTPDAAIILPGIDQMGTDIENGDPHHALVDSIKGELRDQYLEAPISTIQTSFLAVAECEDAIPEYLRSCFTVVRLKPYSVLEKMEVVRRMILPELIEELGMDGARTRLTDDALRSLVTDYSEDIGFSSIRRNLEAVLRSLPELKQQAAVTVDETEIAQILGPEEKAETPIRIFNRFCDLYSEEVRAEIHAILTELANDRLPAARKESQTRRLRYFTSLVPKPLPNVPAANELLSALNKTHFGQNDAKTALVEALCAHEINGSLHTGVNYLFSGPAGSGKTSLARSLAHALGIPFIKLSLNGLRDPQAIKGTPAYISDADAGLIPRGLLKHQTQTAVVLLDEIDKATPSVSQALLDLLDREYMDAFLGLPIGLKTTIIIATCNDLSCIDPYVRDRFTVIPVPGYTLEEKGVILKKYVLPSLSQQLQTCVSIEDSAAELLIRDYCFAPGVRDLKKVSERLARRLAIWKTEAETRITGKTIRASLGPPKALKIRCEAPCGVVNGLAVTGAGGTILPIQAVILEEENVIVTGLPEESVMESVKEAITLMNRRLPKHCAIRGVHLKIGDSSVKKDGPSAGAAICIAMLSAVTDLPVPTGVAMTSAIDLMGNLLPVGGIVEKVTGARCAGCKTLFLPEGNAHEVKKRRADCGSIDIHYVSTIDQIISELFPNVLDKM